MAIRRPASSRARLNNNTNPMPPPLQQRSQSALSRPTSSQRVATNLQDSGNAPLTTKPQDDSETHIQVVLRCRVRSEREVQANSPGIVQIESAKTKELTIETSAPTSSLGIVTLPPTRTYPFDLVFGPEATQSMIYHDVVGPMLDEVMMGYNCTLFAYGQTGTGKTYTMQGDLSPTPMGNPSSHAGIIPRVLFRLFHELEKTYTDFVVKISFIELYNEELRDLLASDLAAPTTLMQPMAMTAKDARVAEGGLKIFDDATKRGVFIQGLEEVAVNDSKMALALLTKGSERRQIAATKFNDHSSRSHSVFSITVHIKETTPTGDDLLKVGKLNLVDLAGSENIGRSGAENKRAREAGMINQSLLTLGRVINALVDKAQHVPYRESKLTRLLQDSLGGRTKTCIIATISPARSNLEETLSTLDYALRAKSIKNKPELNQRMTRNSLLKEYVGEIERLKVDLLAAREKNGIYVSEETWNQLNKESELKETELLEARKQVEIIENQMRNVRDEYDQSIALLKRREEELHETTTTLHATERILREREVELKRVTVAYEQEVIVRQAHQETEIALNEVAIGLKNVATQGLRDVEGLFEKLDRNKTLYLSNRLVVSENEKLISKLTNILTTKLAEFSQLLHDTRNKLEQETKEYQSSHALALENRIQEISDHFDKAQELFKRIECGEVIEEHSIAVLKHQIESIGEAFNTEISSWRNELVANCNRLSEDSATTNIEQITLLEESSTTLSSFIEKISQKIQVYLNTELSALDEIQVLARNLVAKEMSSLQRQNEILAKMLVEERKNGEKAKNDLLQRVSGLLGDFMQKRDDSLKESIGNLQRSNKEVEDLLNSTYVQQVSAHEDMVTRTRKAGLYLDEVNRQGFDSKELAEETASRARELMKTSFDGIQKTVLGSVASHSSWVYQQTQAMEASAHTAFEEHARLKRARIDATSNIRAQFDAHRSSQQSQLVASAKNIETFTNKTLSRFGEQARDIHHYEESSTKNLKSIEQAAYNLATEGVKDDVPTGNTPRKRKWQYNNEWSLTRSREDILQGWKQQWGPPTLVKDSISLPEATRQLDDTTTIVKQSRSASPTSENARIALNAGESNKREAIREEISLVEPLVDSRKRNHVSTTRSSSRRVR